MYHLFKPIQRLLYTQLTGGIDDKSALIELSSSLWIGLSYT